VADDILKACADCKRVLPLSSFQPCSTCVGGVRKQCRDCLSERKRKAYAQNPEAQRKRQNDYFKAHRAAVLAINAKSRQKHAEKVKEHKRLAYLREKDTPEYKARMSAYQLANKEKKREYDKAYRAKRGTELTNALSRAWADRNPEKHAAIKQNYKHRRRAQEEGGISSTDLMAWKKAAKKVCYWCGKKCARNFTVDHYEPLARGGKHEASNLVIACMSCNVKKNAKDPEQFRAETWHGTLFSSLINP
jgi:5-methylcytosine-specific restriction endonuclease McrA